MEDYKCLEVLLTEDESAALAGFAERVECADSVNGCFVSGDEVRLVREALGLVRAGLRRLASEGLNREG